MLDLISPTHDIHRGCTPTRRSVHSDETTGGLLYYISGDCKAQDFPRLSPTPRHAPQGGTRSRFAAVPGVSQLCTVNGDFGRKVTYSPDEPRGWTQRLMNSGVKSLNSYTVEVASSWMKTIPQEPVIAEVAAVVMKIAARFILFSSCWIG